jgi:hypothetical protein
LCRNEGSIRQLPKIRDARNDTHAWCGEPRNLTAMQDGVVRDGTSSRGGDSKPGQHATAEVLQGRKAQKGRVRSQGPVAEQTHHFASLEKGSQEADIFGLCGGIQECWRGRMSGRRPVPKIQHFTGRHSLLTTILHI